MHHHRERTLEEVSHVSGSYILAQPLHKSEDKSFGIDTKSIMGEFAFENADGGVEEGEIGEIGDDDKEGEIAEIGVDDHDVVDVDVDPKFPPPERGEEQVEEEREGNFMKETFGL